jgi:hypothetical protein
MASMVRLAPATIPEVEVLTMTSGLVTTTRRNSSACLSSAGASSELPF